MPQILLYHITKPSHCQEKRGKKIHSEESSLPSKFILLADKNQKKFTFSTIPKKLLKVPFWRNVNLIYGIFLKRSIKSYYFCLFFLDKTSWQKSNLKNSKSHLPPWNTKKIVEEGRKPSIVCTICTFLKLFFLHIYNVHKNRQSRFIFPFYGI